MNISVYQSITVYQLRIGNISNSSVFQIGTSGKINAVSHNYLSGGEVKPFFLELPEKLVNAREQPLVPLPEPAELYNPSNQGEIRRIQ